MDSEHFTDVFLKCPLCFEVLTSPKVLPCQHTFCLDCLQRYVNSKGMVYSLTCHVCNEYAYIPGNEVTNLKDNVMLTSMLEFVRMSKKKKAEQLKELAEKKSPDIFTKDIAKETVCEACGECRYLSNLCKECSMWLCSQCSKAHLKVPATNDHILVENKEVNRGYKTIAVKTNSIISDLHIDNEKRRYTVTSQLQQLTIDKASVASKVRSCTEIFHQIIKDKIQELMDQVDSFYAEKEVSFKRRLREIDEKKETMDNAQKLLSTIQASDDAHKNERILQSIDEFLANDNKPKEDMCIATILNFEASKDTIDVLRGLEIGGFNVLNLYED